MSSRNFKPGLIVGGWDLMLDEELIELIELMVNRSQVIEWVDRAVSFSI
jgi:hypothetical protein